MVITIWGSRGSIPVSGKDYIKYSGDTTCIELRTSKDEIIIIDAGSGIRRLGNKILKEGKKAFYLIFTHFHWDHIIGFPFFKPLFYTSTRISIYGCPNNQRTLEETLSNTITDPYFPVEYRDIPSSLSFTNICNKPFKLGSLDIETISLSHPNGGLGLKFIENGKTFIFLTDNELRHIHPGGMQFDDYVDFCREADFLIHDAEFTQEEYKRTKQWGHSTYIDAVELAVQSNVKQFGLFHHNQDRTDENMEKLVKHSNQIIKDKNSAVDCFAVEDKMEITL